MQQHQTRGRLLHVLLSSAEAFKSESGFLRKLKDNKDKLESVAHSMPISSLHPTGEVRTWLTLAVVARTCTMVL